MVGEQFFNPRVRVCTGFPQLVRLPQIFEGRLVSWKLLTIYCARSPEPPGEEDVSSGIWKAAKVEAALLVL